MNETCKVCGVTLPGKHVIGDGYPDHEVKEYVLAESPSVQPSDITSQLVSLTAKLNEALDRISKLEHRLELGHFHHIDDPFMTDEDTAYAEPDEKTPPE